MFSEELPGETYIVFGETSSPLWKLLIATREAPMTACGHAHRVGYIHPQQRIHAIYRLKVKTPVYPGKITLPIFFVLEHDETFLPYEE